MRSSVAAAPGTPRVVVLGALLAAILASSDAVAQERVVRVGLHPAQPLVFRDTDGRPAGFAVEVLVHIARLEGWTLDWRDGDWNECMDALVAGEIDLLFPIRPTPEREPLIDFTSEDMLTTWGDVFVPRDSSIDTLLDMDGLTVAVVRDDFFSDAFDQTLRSFARSCSYLRLDTWQDVMRAVADGRADAAILERLTGYLHMHEYGLVTPTIPFGASPLLLGVPEGSGPDLLAALDRRLRELKSDPTSAYIRAKDAWFGLRPPDSGIPTWLLGVLAGIAGLLLLSAAFGSVLRHQLAVRTRQLDARHAELQQETADRVRAEEERTRLEDQLRHAQKMEAIGQLATGMAHDFRNLLTVISGHTDRLSGELPQRPDVRESLAMIEKAVQQAASVTRSLLGFSRRLETRLVPIDLCACVEDAARMLARAMPASIEMSVHTDIVPTPIVRADATQMHQVILNLALNARDAMPHGGRLRIAVERDDDHPDEVMVRVSDDGIGMAPEVRERIFEPFFTTKPESGTGLGLATVHSIVQEHGGRLSVTSEPGRGTDFVLHLPLSTRSDPAPNHAERAGRSAGRGELVLLAEDDVQVRQILAAALLAAGYDVLQCRDGEQALQCLRADGALIRLCIFDLEMPRLSGVQTLAAARAAGIATPVILVTASEQGAGLHDGDEAVAVLVKPFGIPRLCSLVRELLDTAALETA